MAYKRKELYRVIAISDEGDSLTVKKATNLMDACATARMWSKSLNTICYVVQDDIERQVRQIIRSYFNGN